MTLASRSCTLLRASAIRSIARRTFIDEYKPQKAFQPSRAPPLDTTQTYTGVIESAEDFRYVERLLPRDTVPPAPTKFSFESPAPSGWIPAAAVPPPLPYFVRRTRWHNLPVYLIVCENGTKHLTSVRHIQGDIWQMDQDLREFMTPLMFDGLVATQVSEVNRFIRLKGNLIEPMKQFLLERGF